MPSEFTPQRGSEHSLSHFPSMSFTLKQASLTIMSAVLQVRPAEAWGGTGWPSGAVAAELTVRIQEAHPACSSRDTLSRGEMKEELFRRINR